MNAQARGRTDDTSSEALNAQYDSYRRMSEADKLRLVFETYRTGRRLAMTGIRMRHPGASDDEVRRLWARQHRGAELFDRAYGVLSRE